MPDTYFEVPLEDNKYTCEEDGCTRRQNLTERAWRDEDHELYYAIKCALHWLSGGSK